MKEIAPEPEFNFAKEMYPQESKAEELKKEKIPETQIEEKGSKEENIPEISKKQDTSLESTKTPEKEKRGTYLEIIQDGMHIVTNDSRQKGPIVTVFYGKETTEPVTIPKKDNSPIRTRQVVSSVDSSKNEGGTKNIKVIKIIDINRSLREK